MNIVRRCVRILILIVVCAYLLLLLLALASDHIIFQPHRASYTPATIASTIYGEAQFLSIPCANGKLGAVYLPNRSARYTLLYSHGNGEDIGDDLPILDDFRQAGFAVFAYDYSGYGLSAGRPSEQAVYRNVEDAYDYLTGTLHVSPEKVIAFGQSLGAAAAIHLATVRPVAGLIAQAPFLSAFRVLTRVPILPWDKFDNARAIRRVHCPVLVVHGRQDEVIPFWHGERIYELANQPKQSLWLDRAHHNDVMVVASRPFIAGLQNFAAQLQK